MCDCPSYFTADHFRTWAADLDIQLVYTAPYAHHSNGLIERYNGILINRVRRFLAEKGMRSSDWDQTLQFATLSIQHSHSPNLGTTPMTLRSGLSRLGVPIPQSTIQLLKKEAARRISLRRSKANRFKMDSPRHYQPGERVWLYKYQRASRLDDKFDSY